MKALVCGGRDYSDKLALWHTLDCAGPPHISAIISGMARGADSLAAEWAINAKLKLYAFPADWNKHGKAAGAIRNQQMLDEGKPDVVIAFPGGRGTADMVSRAKAQGFKVIEVGK